MREWEFYLFLSLWLLFQPEFIFQDKSISKRIEQWIIFFLFRLGVFVCLELYRIQPEIKCFILQVILLSCNQLTWYVGFNVKYACYFYVYLIVKFNFAHLFSLFLQIKVTDCCEKSTNANNCVNDWEYRGLSHQGYVPVCAREAWSLTKGINFKGLLSCWYNMLRREVKKNGVLTW